MTSANYRVFGSLVVVVLLFAPGCELVTTEPPLPILRPADHLVINEVFTLPPTHQNSYTWVELYNPTSDTLDLQEWTLTFTTQRNRIITVLLSDSLFQNVQFIFQSVQPDSFGAFDVPLATSIPGFEETVRMNPGDLCTIVNNEARLLDHTRWGRGRIATRLERSFFAAFPDSVRIDTLGVDSLQLTAYQSGYFFLMNTQEQLILKHLGVIKDVVRFGNYNYTGPVTDPLLGPGNRSVGTVPEFESIYRYAGAYFSGSSFEDFGISRAGGRPVIPTPHDYNPDYKR